MKKILKKIASKIKSFEIRSYATVAQFTEDSVLYTNGYYIVKFLSNTTGLLGVYKKEELLKEAVVPGAAKPVEGQGYPRTEEVLKVSGGSEIKMNIKYLKDMIDLMSATGEREITLTFDEDKLKVFNSEAVGVLIGIRCHE